MRVGLLLATCSLALLATFVACSSDEGSRSDVGGAGGGDAGSASGAGGSGRGGSGAGSPTGGNAGRGGAGGEAPSLGGQGGAGSSSVDDGGASGQGGATGEAGAGGAPAVCPQQPTPTLYSCAEIAALAPTVERETSELSLELPGLEHPIESGSVSFFYQTEDALSCGETELLRGEGTRVFVNMQTLFIPGTLRIWAFELVDTCGQHHVFDPSGAVCSELSGTVSSPTFSLSCSAAPGNTCPAQCI